MAMTIDRLETREGHNLTAAEAEHKRIFAKTLANNLAEVILNRPVPAGIAPRPLMVYDRTGRNKWNPADGARTQTEQKIQKLAAESAKLTDPEKKTLADSAGYLAGGLTEQDQATPFQKELELLTYEASLGLTADERGYMSRIVPQLAAALVLDQRHVGKVYEKDLLNIAKLSIKWFKNPQTVGQTEYLVGFGGETQVGSRLPAYIVPPLTSLERVNNTYQNYINWAISNEIYQRNADQNGSGYADTSYVDTTLFHNFSAAITDPGKRLEFDRKFAEAEDPKADNKAVSEELRNRKYLTTQEARQALSLSWRELFNAELDLNELAEKYHFTQDLPTLLAFNASEHAITLNGMNRAQVMNARTKSQDLLKAFTAEFSPGLEGQVVTRNDRPLSENSFYSNMLTFYTIDMINAENGDAVFIQERLAKFEEHHKVAGPSTYMGRPVHQFYGGRHPIFFSDPQVHPDIKEKLPPTDVMENPTTPVNTVWFQGAPEITFGFDRKVFSEQATTSGFIEWLKNRKEASEHNYDQLAEVVTNLALSLKNPNSPKPFKAYLGEALNTLFLDHRVTDPEKKALAAKKREDALRALLPDKNAQDLADITTELDQKAAARGTFTTFMGSADFKSTQDQEVAWKSFATKLKNERVTEDPNQIQALIDEMTQHLQKMDKYKADVIHAETVGDAKISNPEKRSVALSQTDEASLAWSGATRVELTVDPIGDRPTYYPLEGSDAVVSARELPSYKQYDQAYEETREWEKRLKETASLAERTFRESLAAIGPEAADSFRSADQSADLFALMIAGTFDPRKDDLSAKTYTFNDRTLNLGEKWASLDRQNLMRVLDKVDSLEATGASTKEVMDLYNSEVNRLVTNRLAVINRTPGLATNQFDLPRYFSDDIARPTVDEIDHITTDARVARIAVRGDYFTLLDHIDRGGILPDYLKVRTMEQKLVELEGRGPLVNGRAVQAEKIRSDIQGIKTELAPRLDAAEARYHRVLASVFN